MVILKNITKSFSRGLKVLDNISLEIKQGEFFSILGPSGVGKTTLLRLIAGLERPDSGEIIIDGKVVSGPFEIPPEKREVALVFQDLALFPHLNVFENVAFALQRIEKRLRRKMVLEALELVGLLSMEHRYPYELSGGERQRVALARALVGAPKILLLDEPFSSLDKTLRIELRREVRKIVKARGITTILVTHDQEEALSISDRIGILGHHGRFEQVGAPQDIYFRPCNLFVAKFIGQANFIEGLVKGGNFLSPLITFNGKDLTFWEGKKVLLMLRPEDVRLKPNPEGRGIIKQVEFLGADLVVEVDFFKRWNIQARYRARELALYPGTKVDLYPPEQDKIHFIDSF